MYIYICTCVSVLFALLANYWQDEGEEDVEEKEEEEVEVEVEVEDDDDDDDDNDDDAVADAAADDDDDDDGSLDEFSFRIDICRMQLFVALFFFEQKKTW